MKKNYYEDRREVYTDAYFQKRSRDTRGEQFRVLVLIILNILLIAGAYWYIKSKFM